MGLAVAHRPPFGVDAQARALAGHAIGLAEVFTRSCLWYVLLPFCIGLLIVAALSRAWRGRALFSVAVLAAGWQISDVLKNFFARPRPEYWYYVHETSYAYSSGHAMFATTVYGLWAYFIAKSSLPPAVRAAGATLLGAWAVGIIWSRLALGAHYPSDLAGGALLGVMLLAAGALIASTISQGWRRSPVGEG